MSAAVSLCPAFHLRSAVVADAPFVIKPWLQQLRDEASTRHVPDAVYFQKQGRLVQRLLDTYPTTVAVDSQDPGHFYGFVCGSPSVVHWLYVKGTYRGLGIGAALLRAAVAPLELGKDPVVCSHASHVFNDRSLVKKYKLVHDPYVLRGI